MRVKPVSEIGGRWRPDFGVKSHRFTILYQCCLNAKVVALETEILGFNTTRRNAGDTGSRLFIDCHLRLPPGAGSGWEPVSLALWRVVRRLPVPTWWPLGWLGTRIHLEVAPQIIMIPVSAMTPVGIYHH